MTLIIPLSSLKGACKLQMAVVRDKWPAGVPVTTASLRAAIDLGLDLDWAAKFLLTGPAWAEYEIVRGSAWAEYQARAEDDAVADQQAWEEYNKVRGQALLALLRKPANWKRRHERTWKSSLSSIR